MSAAALVPINSWDCIRSVTRRQTFSEILATDDQMHAQRPPQRGEPIESLHVVGQQIAQGMEFIDDHHEPCRWMLQLIDVRYPLLTDQRLTPYQFPFDGVQGTYGMR